MDKIESSQADEAFNPQNIRFPQSFELRLIVRADARIDLEGAIPAALAALGIAHSPPRFSMEEAKVYGKARLSATFMNLEAMHAAYASLAALPGVKAVI